jgi:hypothetical protein
MKRKLFFTIIALVSCLAILLAVVVSIPRSVHASVEALLSLAPAPTLTVSPTAIDISKCSSLNFNDYVLCTVTLSINQPPKNGLIWTSTHNATLCLYYTCKPDYYVAVLPSQGSLSAAGSSVQVSIIVSDYCYHGHENATFTFAIPGSTAKVKYYCNQP